MSSFNFEIPFTFLQFLSPQHVDVLQSNYSFVQLSRAITLLHLTMTPSSLSLLTIWVSQSNSPQQSQSHLIWKCTALCLNSHWNSLNTQQNICSHQHHNDNDLKLVPLPSWLNKICDVNADLAHSCSNCSPLNHHLHISVTLAWASIHETMDTFALPHKTTSSRSTLTRNVHDLMTQDHLSTRKMSHQLSIALPCQSAQSPHKR